VACGANDVNNQDPDPVAQTFPIAYIKRTFTVGDGSEIDPDDEIVLSSDLTQLSSFNPGAAVYIRSSASPGGSETNISDRAFDAGALYDVKDLEASSDGNLLIFAMRAPEIEDADDEDQPKWNIWEYSITTDTLLRIIESDITAEDGHDIAPYYLPVGDIIFSSTRQRTSKAILLDESKPQFEALDESRDEPAFLLHAMQPDGGDIRQLTFNQSHDTDPTVLANGEIVFTRWDHMGGNDSMNLYTMNPDGTEVHLLYGRHSHNTGTDDSAVQFHHPREMPDGRIMVILRPNSRSDYGGDIVAIDTENFIDNDMPVASNLGAVNSAQTSLSTAVIATDDSVSLAGRYTAAFPLNDGTERLLLAWSQCRINVASEGDAPVNEACTEENILDSNEALTLSVLKTYDPSNNTERPIVVPEEGVLYSEVVALQAYTTPPIVYDKTAGVGLDADFEAEGVGVLHIRSVYDFAGIFNDMDNGSSGATTLAQVMDPINTGIDSRPARFLRLIKAVSLPDDDVDNLPTVPGNVLGADNQQMKEILGYATIEPDGSVRVKVPANVPFIISVLDLNGRRLGGRHKNWMVVREGEEVECLGCHTRTSLEPHGRSDAEATTLNSGAPTDGYNYPNTDLSIAANMGETMAQAITRLQPSRLNPTMDIIFQDLWTDEAQQVRQLGFSLTYDDVDFEGMSSTAPTSDSCITNWSNACRSIINYEEHIHSIWEVERLDPAEFTNVRTCVDCHHREKSDDALKLEQLATDCQQLEDWTETGLLSQLNLTDSPSNNNFFASNNELLARNEGNDGVLRGYTIELAYDGDDLQARRGELVFDEFGEPVFIDLDEDGEPDLFDGLPVQEAQTISTSRKVNRNSGARNSTTFFNMFTSTGCHPNWLDEHELRIISEWLDLGGQYYNNPFDVPQD